MTVVQAWKSIPLLKHELMKHSAESPFSRTNSEIGTHYNRSIYYYIPIYVVTKALSFVLCPLSPFCALFAGPPRSHKRPLLRSCLQ